jgi:hypothetical protein
MSTTSTLVNVPQSNVTTASTAASGQEEEEEEIHGDDSLRPVDRRLSSKALGKLPMGALPAPASLPPSPMAISHNIITNTSHFTPTEDWVSLLVVI